MPAKNFCAPEKERYWRSVLEQFESTGLNGKEFCRREGIKYTLFADWRQRIRHRNDDGIQAIERTDAEWIEIIEAARKNPDGVREYLEKARINEKAYYKRFNRLRRNHPEWATLSGRGGRRKGRRYSKRAISKSPVQADQDFTQVQLVESPKVKAIHSGPIIVEVVLPNSLIVRVGADCSLEFLSSLVATLGRN